MKYSRVQVAIFGSRMDRLYTYIAPGDEIHPGMLVEAPFGKQFKPGVIVKTLAPAVRGKSLKPFHKTFFPFPVFHPYSLALAEWIALRFFFTVGEVLPLFLHPALEFQRFLLIGRGKHAESDSEDEVAVLSCLPEEGFLTLQQLERACSTRLSMSLLRRMARGQKIVTESHYSINASSITAGVRIREMHDGPGYALFWKQDSDEEDFQRAEEIVRRGNQVLIMAPEKRILLSLRERFPVPTYVYHTGIALRERKDVWHKMADGLPGIYLGSRSIVFVPIPHLKEIWMYGENDERYEHQKYPRYRADAVVQKMAEMRKIPLHLFTPAPSARVFLRLRDEERVRLGHTQSVKIFSLREKRISYLLTVSLYEELKGLWSQREKGIILVERRGYSSLLCKSCGHFLSCPRCGSSLVLSKEQQKILCRRCSLKEIESASASCPVCGSAQLQEKGVGRERVVRELHRLFPALAIYSLDSDVAPAEEQQQRIVKEFRETEGAAALVATSIVLGEEAPPEAFRVVLLGEHFWGFPEYSASERALSIFLRFFQERLPGYLQTYSPGMYLVRALETGNLLSFYEREISLRSHLLFPPFVHLLKISLKSREVGKLRQESRKIIRWLKHRMEEGVQLLGPIDWQNMGSTRQVQILVKTLHQEWLQKIKEKGFLNLLRTLSVRSEVEVDSDA